MIPKIIHYCWFGRGEMPRLAKKCIRSWQKYCPDYELRMWNEDNFDLDRYPYAREAYGSRKFAFVTDVVRLYAMYREGGIYMDTDVELTKPLDPFLKHVAFTGFEDESMCVTGIMASEKGGKWAKDNLEYYETHHFLLPDGTIDGTPNTQTLTDYLAQAGVPRKNGFYDITDLITIYPKDYFCPLSYKNEPSTFSENTVAIHHFAGSWLSFDSRLRMKHPRLYKWWYYCVFLPRYEWRTKVMRKKG